MYLDGLNKQHVLSGLPEVYMKSVKGSTTVNGTASNDVFHGSSGNRLVGGQGDDTYYIWNANVAISESMGQGIDTAIVEFWGKYILPDNVENAILEGAGSTGVTGNALDNILIAGTAGATLNGGAGNDVLVGGAGGDIFVVSAGSGSDSIYNFTTGYDIVKLSGYGINSWADLTSRAAQTGADVTIGLPNSERLVIRGVNLGDLDATDFGFAPAPLAVQPGWVMQYGAGVAHNVRGWIVLNNAWNIGSMQEGVDFSINSSYNPTDVSAGVVFNWNFPAVAESFTTIRAYPEIIYGVAPAGGAQNPKDTAKVFPVKVADIIDLKVDHDVVFDGHVGGFNVAYDIWLTNKPYGLSADVTNEIMIWVHKGDLKPFGTQIGTYSYEGHTAKVFHTGTYTAVVFDDDLPTATLDLGHLFDALGQLGIVSKDEYLASIELGAEVASGGGSLTIKDFDFTLVQADVDGGTTTKAVTGVSTVVTHTPPAEAGTPPLAVSPAPVPTPPSLANQVVVEVIDGVTITQTYDALGVLAHFERMWTIQSTTTIERYDGNAVLLGKEVMTPSDGGIQTMHYVGTRFIGADTHLVDAQGLTYDTFWDADWNMQKRVIVGTDGNDAIYGGAGTNEFHGGLGSDIVKGNSGKDIFYFDTAIGNGDIDAVRAFASGTDVIVLDHDIFTALAPGDLANGAFVLGTVAGDAGDHILYNKNTGALYYDPDGNGAAAAIQFATLDKGALLSAHDFLVI